MTWIPVTEHLPDADDMVLVTCRAKNGNLSVNRAYCDEQGFWHGSGSMAGVTAWMPLPKPYREGDTTPTIDVVEVVRCKDCKFYWKNSVMTNVPLCLASPKDDAFCSEGKRREER